MSGLRKLLLGGAVCCLIASLMIPLPSGNGIDGKPDLLAGVRPKFRKPWLKKRSSSKKNVKSYPIPDGKRQPKFQPEPASKPELDLQTQPAETVEPAGTKSVMQELQELYEQNGQEAPDMSQYHPQPRQHQSGKKPHAKKKNIFSRVYEKLTGKSKSHPTPEQTPEYEPEGLPDWDQSGSGSAEEIVSSPSMQELPEPTEPVDIIIPPQPQPNFLPGLDVSDVDEIKPAITEGVDTVDADDPFPLPPLPSEVGVPSTADSNKTELVQSPDNAVNRKGKEKNASEVFLPLPGIDSEETVSTEPDQSMEQFSEPVQKTARLELNEASAENLAKPNHLSSLTEPSEPGDRKSKLPPAPSAVESTSAKPGRSVITKVPATYQGWRSRDGQPLPLEPNTFSAPVEARPATASQPAIVHKQDASEKYQRIRERGSRTGFKGFCPVVLRDHLELVDASPAFRIEYEGVIYYFSSADALEKFQESPVRYAPAHGGIDLVKYATEGVEELGRLDYAVWYHDRLHLFATQQSMEQFKSTPENYLLEN